MSTDDLEDFEADRELHLAQEYQDVAGMFRYAIETERPRGAPVTACQGYGQAGNSSNRPFSASERPPRASIRSGRAAMVR